LQPATSEDLLDLLADSRHRLTAVGFNLWGITRIDDFDGAECRGCRLGDLDDGSVSAVVVGSGGRHLWERMQAQGLLPAASGSGSWRRQCRQPIDAHARRMLDEEAALLRARGHEVCTVFPFDRGSLSFQKLAEASGLGVISPVVGFLLHPAYGPWVSLHGALVFKTPLPPTGELRDFAPCTGCPAPCLGPCPVSVYEGPNAPAHLDRCARHRDAGNCVTGCEVRRACPVGAEHRHGPMQESERQAAELHYLRRQHGIGLWKLVPARWRR
jgi:hypothetical protein